MDKGQDFLRAQVHNCISQHDMLLNSIRAHVEQADDGRFKALCSRHLPHMEKHQGLLEEYAKSIGVKDGNAVKNAIGAVVGKARDVVDSMRETDFLRVVQDVVMIRQAQDTFAVFASAGDTLGDQRLAELGRTCGKEHERMQKEFNEYVTKLFVEHVTDTDSTDVVAASS